MDEPQSRGKQGDGARRESLRAARKRWRDASPEKVRAARLRWNAANPEKVREIRQRWVETHREEINTAQRERELRKRDAVLGDRRAEQLREERKEAKRQYARAWYAANKPLHQEIQRRYRERQRAENPEEFRARLRAANQRWRDSHREQIRQHQRDKDRDAPATKRENAARYYAAHADEVKQRKREKYWADHEKSLADQRQYRAREKWRRANGLPPQRLHRVTGTERKTNLAAADAFFTRARTGDEITRLRGELGTPRYLIEQFERANARDRAAAHYAESLTRVGGRLDQQVRPTRAERNAMARADDEARMDAVAAAINDRLRTQPKAPARSMPVAGPQPPTASAQPGRSR